jgi:predicted DNA binding CopG/RHH family protein
MMKKDNIKYLDEEEKDLEKAIESIDVTKIRKPSPKLQKQLKKAARDHLKKETKMNIRIDPFELDKIKKNAKREGLRYQTFIKSILHKYLTGQLVEKDRITG